MTDIKPEDVKAALVQGTSASTASPSSKALSAPRTTSDVLGNISSSYFHLRRGIAVIGVSLPIILWLGHDYRDLQHSMSAYYHTNMGDVFVGALWAIGSFLLFYRGYSKKEDIALNFAGIAVALVGILPTDPVGMTTTSTIGWMHGTSAVIFFLLIAFVSLFCARDTVDSLDDEDVRKKFLATYRTIGVAMVAMPIAIVLAHFLLSAFTTWVFFIEVAGVYVFATYWLVKSREIAAIEKQAGAR